MQALKEDLNLFTNVDTIPAKNIINSFNDWDPLEEVIVGVVNGATVPPLEPVLKACTYPKNWWFFEKNAGKLFPKELIEPAAKELEDFCHILQAEGVIVKRPEILDFTKIITTPDFQTTGLYAAMPRDILVVIGNEIIEAPMAWRSRFFEFRAYRQLMREYLVQGGRWTVAPKSEMSDALYDQSYLISSIEERHSKADRDEFATTEHSPCFDAADITRCGKDIFIQRSQVTNNFAITWLRNHLKGKFRVHKLKFKDPNPMHIDATFVPLKPGLILANPDRPCYQIENFKKAGWDIIKAAQPSLPDNWPLYLSSKWLCMNILLLDQQRVIVEKQELPTQKLFKRLGYKVIPVDFRHVYTFGGSFHCVTCDVRRTGKLEDYNLNRFFDYEEF